MEKGRTGSPIALFLILATTFISGSHGLEIVNIEGPGVVVNGTSNLLVLDCSYDLTEFDKASLVVKWYFNRQPYPVYQWIPHNEPQDLGMLKGRVHLQYKVSDDEYSKHRALAIVNPTTELSGEYTCWISSFESEDYKRKDVIVYAPASEMSMSYTKPRDDSVLVSCKASGIYPAPAIAIYRSSSSDRRALIEGAKVKSQVAKSGSFDISVELEAFDFNLDSETMFECDVTIPGTEYKQQERILYFPGMAAVKAPVSGGERTTVGASLALWSLLLLCFQHLVLH